MEIDSLLFSGLFHVLHSNRLSPLAKDIVNELGHGFGATVPPAVASMLKLFHHMADELCEEVGDLQVVLSCRNLLEEAFVLLAQRAALLFTHLAAVA